MEKEDEDVALIFSLRKNRKGNLSISFNSKIVNLGIRRHIQYIEE